MANPFKRASAPVPLTTQLVDKASSLIQTAQFENESAQSFASLSAVAAAKSKEATRHAAAVEQALGILHDAGVE